MKTCTTILLLIFATSLNAADWQYAGSSGNDEGTECNFINADSILHPAKDVVRFWVKSLTVTKLTEYYAQHEKLIAQKTAARVARKYSPRFLMLRPIKEKVAVPDLVDGVRIELIRREIIANQPDALATTKTFFELDCKQQQLKILDFITFDESGRQNPKAADRSDDYEPIPAGSNGELLALWACSVPTRSPR